MTFLRRVISISFAMTLFLPWMQVPSHGFLIADMQQCATKFTGTRQNSNSKHQNSTQIQSKKKGSDSGLSKSSPSFLVTLGLCISCFCSGAALQAKFGFIPNPISSASSISLQCPTTELSCVPEAIKKVEQSVVRINTLKPTLINDRRESPMEQFEESQGSGVLFDSEGLILTNAHVVERMKNIVITLADGRQYSAEIKGSDEQIDIAVLKINPKEGERFAHAKFGNSDKIEVGQVVVALGSPCSLDQTATMGIVSGIGRSPADVGIFDKKDLNVDYIQTDASMNLGSSGGPLVDVESGCIIGINTRIRVHMEGTGFSIPINKVKEILPDLSIRSYIGAFIDNVKPQENWFISRAIVSKVYHESPAAVGGLMKNDIILKIGDEEIKSNEDVCRCIDRAIIGEPLKIIVLRDESETNISIRPVSEAKASWLKQIDKEAQSPGEKILLAEDIRLLSVSYRPRRV